MFVCRVSKPVCRQTRLDDKRDYLNPFVTRVTVCHDRRRQTGKVLVTGVSSFFISFVVVCRRVLNDTRAKPALCMGFPFVICVTPKGGKRVDTPPHKWKPVRHNICRILGLTMVEQN